MSPDGYSEGKGSKEGPQGRRARFKLAGLGEEAGEGMSQRRDRHCDRQDLPRILGLDTWASPPRSAFPEHVPSGQSQVGKGAPGQIAWEGWDGFCCRISQTATWRGSRISKEGQPGCVPTPMSPTFPEVPLGMSAVKNVGWGSLPVVGNDSRI